ncbi:MAG: dTMP kinase, partial [Treponema sp.]|nr:dTMP kinase [Treponema sp.]
KGEFSIDEKTIAYLFAADRCEHIYGKNGIIENLQNGKLVVSDRYFFSSIAYQSIMAGDDLPKKLNENFPLPEFLFFFKISSDKAFKRVSKRGEEKEIYEKIDFQKKVEQNYEKIINSYKNDTNTSNKKIENTNKKNATSMKIITLDANLPVEEVSKIIWTHLKNLPILNM